MLYLNFLSVSSVPQVAERERTTAHAVENFISGELNSDESEQKEMKNLLLTYSDIGTLSFRVFLLGRFLVVATAATCSGQKKCERTNKKKDMQEVKASKHRRNVFFLYS